MWGVFILFGEYIGWVDFPCNVLNNYIFVFVNIAGILSISTYSKVRKPCCPHYRLSFLVVGLSGDEDLEECF